MDLTDELSDMLASALSRHDLPGAVLAVRTQDGAAEVAAGLSDVGSGAPLTPAHTFRLWSIVKPAVGLAFARLVDAGTLAWSDTAASLLPELRSAEAGCVTVDQLLGMTAGLAEVPLAVPPTGDTPSDLLPVIADAGLADVPGSAWSYSNPAYGLLGAVLERVTGRNWLDALTALVLEPAGMSGVTVREKLTGAVASEHVGAESVDGLDMEAFGAAGTRLWGGISDMLALGSALISPDASTLREEQAAVPVPYLADAWCRGLARFDWPEATAFGWDGIGIGVRNLLRVVPERGLVVALSVNGNRGRLLWNDLVPDVIEAVGGGHVPRLSFEASNASPDHGPIVGTYERKGLPPAEITVEGDDLVARDLFGSRVLKHLYGDVYLSNADDPDWPTVTLRPDAYYLAGFHLRRV